MPYFDPRAIPFVIVALGILGLTFYFIPSIIAYNTGHPHRLAILIVNILFGVTGIGWIGPLIWALVTPQVVQFPIAYGIIGREPQYDSDRRYGDGSRTEPRLPEPTKSCFACAETIKAAAIRCRFCGFEENTS